MRLPLRWIAILYGRVPADFAMTGGVHTGIDVLKAVMAGACVTNITSEFLMKGPGRVPEMLERDHPLDGRARVCFHRADERQHEPAGRG